MEVTEIILVSLVALALIVPGYFMRRFKSKNKSQEKTKGERIVLLIVGLLFLGLIWFLTPPGGLIYKVLLSILALGSIFNNLKGWVFMTKTKVEETA